VTTSKTPCAFAAAKLSLAPGQSATVTSVYGRAVSQSQYDDVIKNRVTEVRKDDAIEHRTTRYR
jgi:hypothetical protein